jgi:hypothetical protein
MQFEEIGFEFGPKIIIFNIMNASGEIVSVFNGQATAFGSQM